MPSLLIKNKQFSEFIRRIEVDGKVTRLNPEVAKKILSRPLKCHRCDAMPKNMPELKKHILQHIKQD